MQKYHAAGKPCPLAISLGQNPQVYMASQLPMPLGVDEYGVAGWLQNSPVEVVESAHTGLPLPADGEVVLEGEIPVYVELATGQTIDAVPTAWGPNLARVDARLAGPSVPK